MHGSEEKTHPNKESIEEFLGAFKMASERRRLGLLNGLEERVEELLGLGSTLMSGFDPCVCDWPPGFILQLIHKTDGDFIKNEFNKRVYPLGYDKYSNYLYTGNKKLILNSVQYLCDDNKLISLRNRTLPLNLIRDKLTFSSLSRESTVKKSWGITLL